MEPFEKIQYGRHFQDGSHFLKIKWPQFVQNPYKGCTIVIQS